MHLRKKLLFTLIFSTLIFAFASTQTAAQGKEYESVVKHLKSNYQAKKVRIPFMWLARFAVGIVRPAGVKSFSVTMFEDLKFSSETLDREMQNALRNSFSAEWSPIFRARSRDGEQVYMYMRESGNSIKLTLVVIDKTNAAVIRAKFNPDKLAEFINDPKIFGISLNDKSHQVSDRKPASNEASTPEDKSELP